MDGVFGEHLRVQPDIVAPYMARLFLALLTMSLAQWPFFSIAMSMLPKPDAGPCSLPTA